jgi:hypothetical protein
MQRSCFIVPSLESRRREVSTWFASTVPAIVQVVVNAADCRRILAVVKSDAVQEDPFGAVMPVMTSVLAPVWTSAGERLGYL